MIELRGVTHRFGLLPVLRGVDLEVAAGEAVALVGPNGAGKTTLLRIVATLLKPSGGMVKIGGWPLPVRADRVRRHIGFISHQPLAYGDLSAVDNLQFFARLYGLDRPVARAEEALRMVGLYGRGRDYVRTFSRGMLQRLTIARVTLHNPEVLLLDEPYTGLDQTAVGLLDELLREQRRQKRTILMITHDLLHGRQLVDRTAILHRGRIVDELTHDEIEDAAFIERYREIITGRS